MWQEVSLIFTIDNFIVETLNHPLGIGKPLNIINLSCCEYKIEGDKINLKETKEHALYN